MSELSFVGNQDSPSLFVPLTVTLELEWVLRAFYRFDAAPVVQVIEHLLGLANVNVEEAGRVAQATHLLGQGMDFADALHLAASGHCEALYTFDDRRFARRSQRLGIVPSVSVPLGASESTEFSVPPNRDSPKSDIGG